MKVHFDDKYGVTVVHDTGDWSDAVRNYKINVLKSGRYSSSQNAFENEFRIMEKLKPGCVGVNVVLFKTDESKKLFVVDAP